MWCRRHKAEFKRCRGNTETYFDFFEKFTHSGMNIHAPVRRNGQALWATKRGPSYPHDAEHGNIISSLGKYLYIHLLSIHHNYVSIRGHMDRGRMPERTGFHPL